MGWASWNLGIRNDQTWGTWVEGTWSPMFTGFVFLMILSLIPHLSLKLRSPYGTNFDSRDMLSDRMQAVECSDFIFVAGMYPEIEKKEKKWKAHGILQRTAVRHWLSQTWRVQTLKTQHGKCSACHGFGHLGQSHWIFRCPRHASIIFFWNQSIINFSCHHEISVLNLVQFGNP